MGRNERENMVMESLAVIGWSDDARPVGAVGAYRAAYGLPFHDKGTGNGRRTILVDGFRAGPSGRFDFLAVKGHRCEPNRPHPSDIDLVTGNPETLAAIVDAVNRGASIPVVVFASDDVDPSMDGWVRCFDAAPIIRANAAHVLAAPVKWSRGTAPAARSSDRTRAAGKYSYTALTIGFTGAGSSAGQWIRANMADLPGIVERTFDWSPAGHSFIY